MTALQNQPLLFRQLACAAQEARHATGTAYLDVFARVADDFDRAGFPELARQLALVVEEARGGAEDKDEELKEALEKIEELEAGLEKAVKKAGEAIRDDALEWINLNNAIDSDDTRDALQIHLDDKIAQLDAEDLAS